MKLHEEKTLRRFVVFLSLATMIVGVLGMIICFFVLWLWRKAHVVGAGIGFLSSAVLTASGLISLALQASQTTNTEAGK